MQTKCFANPILVQEHPRVLPCIKCWKKRIRYQSYGAAEVLKFYAVSGKEAHDAYNNKLIHDQAYLISWIPELLERLTNVSSLLF